MVVPLGPGKFYGSSLPRPRFFADVKLNPDRVDPPVSVMDPLLSWAQEAHWSMGGLSFQRLRLQGRIEGNVKKLRKQRETQARSEKINISPQPNRDPDNGEKGVNRKRDRSVSPPPAPKVAKRRRYVGLFDEDDETTEEEERGGKGPVRRLVGEFDRVAKESESASSADGIAIKIRRRGSEKSSGRSGGVGDIVMKVVEEINSEGRKLKGGKKGKSGSPNGTRTSPRLAKRRSN